MVFSSAIFLWLFLPIVFALNFIAREKCSNYILLIASLIFYAWGEPVYVLLMLLSIAINYAMGRLIDRFETKKKLFLVIGIIADLGLLGYFKYAGFFVETINGITGNEILPNPNVVLPIGISFFTFQAMSYMIDVYRGETECSKNIVNVALYISFFPQLIAGPIVKYKDINEQIKHRQVTYEGVSDGFRRFVYGLSKKVLLSNVMGAVADTIFGYEITEIPGGVAWIGALCYTFQIYYDFSGYSDMAIGLGRMFGFTFLENFNYPYVSKTVKEFWRRWHISLGSWFREYVYIPLGGNRQGAFRTYINLIIVFYLTGLWHGANWTFVLWGLFHGVFSMLERGPFGRFMEKRKIISHIYLMLVVIFGWVLFRSNTIAYAFSYMGRMVTPWLYSDVSLPLWAIIDKKDITIFIASVLGCGIIQNIVPKKVRDWFSHSALEAVYLLVLLVCSLAAVASDTYNPFIYFQF